jgi:hypothetical protein
MQRALGLGFRYEFWRVATLHDVSLAAKDVVIVGKASRSLVDRARQWPLEHL